MAFAGSSRKRAAHRETDAAATTVHSRSRLLSSIRRVWDWLTEPSASATDYEERLKSRWMAAMFVVLVPLGLLIASIPPLVDRNPPWGDPQVRGVVVLSAFLSLCYLLSRRGYYRASALSALVAATIAILSISLIDNDPSNVISDASYLVATVLFSSIMLSQRLTGVVLVLSVFALLAQPLISPQVSMEGILKGPMSLLLTTYGLIVFGISLRDALEKHHVVELEKENAERQRAESHLSASLQEKEILLKEIHHRVKNNLQIVSSLLNLQSGAVDEPRMLTLFLESQTRIHTMALIHEHLYRSTDLAHIDFPTYLRELTSSLVDSYCGYDRHVALSVDAAGVRLDIDTAIPCGLIVNELVSNALKHAFVGRRSGTIGVEMRCFADGQYRLVVWDDGVGFSEGIDPQDTPSLGLQLVQSLVRQLGGTFEVTSASGARITICFPGSGNRA